MTNSQLTLTGGCNPTDRTFSIRGRWSSGILSCV
jgi:hypothetical protein